MFKYALIVFSSAALSLVATPLVRRIAIRCGAMDIPGGRHIHSVPTPRFGGLAVHFSVVFGLIIAGLADPFVAAALLGTMWRLSALAAAASALMLVGLADDRRPLRPALKLAAEILAGVVAVAAGYRIDELIRIDLGWFGPVVTVFWIVAIINAVNMIDGLDGLAAGAGLIIGATLFSVSLYLGHIQSALILAALSGALLGFLCYNFHPARIFLGDSGSLPIGFLLATIAIRSSSKAATFAAIVSPLLALGLPLTELAATALRRSLRAIQVIRLDDQTQRYEFSFFGRPALFTADRDHIHHRLLAMGINYGRAVLVLHAACAALGAGAFLLVAYRGANLAWLLLAFALAAAAVGRLGYREFQPFRNGLLLPLFNLRAMNRRFVYVLCDLGFIGLSYAGACLILFGAAPASVLSPPLRDVPAFAAAQLACFMAAGLYRLSYRHAGIADLLTMGKALALAGIGGWAALLATRHAQPPASLLVLDAYLLATLLIGSRLSFRMLDHLFTASRTEVRRAMIYGAGNGGVAALRELRSSSSIGMRVTGFIDDDPLKSGRMLQGLPIYGLRQLETLILGRELDAVVIATDKIAAERVGQMARRCTLANIALYRFHVMLDQVDRAAERPPMERLADARAADALR